MEITLSGSTLDASNFFILGNSCDSFDRSAVTFSAEGQINNSAELVVPEASTKVDDLGKANVSSDVSRGVSSDSTDVAKLSEASHGNDLVINKPTFARITDVELPPEPKPTVVRITDVELPSESKHTAMIDVAIVAETRDLAIDGAYAFQLYQASAISESGQPTVDSPDNASPRMTVDGARGRGQLFELAMASDREQGMLLSKTTAQLPNSPNDADHQEWFAATASLSRPMSTIAARSTDSAVQSPLSTNVAQLSAHGDASQETFSHEDAERVHFAEDQAESGESADVNNELILLTLSDQPAETDEAKHDAVLAAFNDEASKDRLSPLYLDDKRHVELAAVLVTAITAGRVVRLEEPRLTPKQTYLTPPRRRRS